eukprot:CAMPEP_0196600568 /NCGR_PEP_ID=MMETSP1081-20130531/95456_1 /TAXON_ID=36882 /ORGANISM="Pyramimonas amylifera, Strain CCMP720" /LENGTH=59 /DNA_ID=CAMNT_0041926411 /DNA_START=519 /DNA_END=698 /DNA_ORIENTATION=+
MPAPLQNLGGHVLCRAAETPSVRVRTDPIFGKSEVSEAHMSIHVQQHVLRLEISVDDVE